MEELFYELKPYLIISLGLITILNPFPWWGIVSGSTLITLGVLIAHMRKVHRNV